MINLLVQILLIIYALGWVYTAIIFWKYGVEHGRKERSILSPVPASILLAFFWPIIFSLMMFSKEKDNGTNTE